MAAPRRTQKEIAERYRGNLGRYMRLYTWKRARFTVALLAVLGSLFAIFFFQRHGHETFFNPGKISAPHAKFADDCAKCHDQSLMRGGPLTPAQFKQVVSDRFHHGVAFGPIDKKCEACHTHHILHEPNVVQSRSCSACHQEHRGLQSLTQVASAHCASCHDNSQIMEASAQKGMQLNWANFHRHPHPPQQVTFEPPRPPRGYTQPFASFWNGHREFQLIRDKARDPDVLRFNHQRHFASDIPPVNGKKLDCDYCHQPDAEGRYYQRISFAANCQACHSLQFDPKNPELTLPHGSATAVRAFLRTLPTQYAELAVKKGITGQNQIRNFVAKQMTQLRDRVRSGENLEREVFFATDPYKLPEPNAPRSRASFYGCAFCHKVKPVANAAPIVTKPVLVDRWMPQAKFNHAKHRTDPNTQKPLDCDVCHHARQSRETSDVLMPARATCMGCHSPQGKVAADCIVCHTFHAPLAAQTAGAASSTRDIMTGQR
jgi:predicted CXXCH cytochrome family protein